MQGRFVRYPISTTSLGLNYLVSLNTRHDNSQNLFSALKKFSEFNKKKWLSFAEIDQGVEVNQRIPEDNKFSPNFKRSC